MRPFKERFNAEKSTMPSISSSAIEDLTANEHIAQPKNDNSSVALNGGTSGSLQDPKSSRPLHANPHFERLERQFEALHDHLQTRASFAHPREVIAAAKSVRARTRRHVDLLEALFSSHRYRMRMSAMSPIMPYNEDIAERNMTRFLQEQYSSGKAYSRFISAIYQEDVADRNIARSRGSSSNSSPRIRIRPSPGATQSSASSQSTGQSRKKCDFRWSSASAGEDCEDPKRSTTASSENLLPRSQSPHGSYSQSFTEEPLEHSDSLRQQKSAPDLSSVDRFEVSANNITASSVNHLEVPMVRRLRRPYRNVPLPDSPTVPDLLMPPSDMRSLWDVSGVRRCASLDSRTRLRKNVLHLSIDTKLAASTKPAARISHCSVQPPTPTDVDPMRRPSIAEVLNNALPTLPTPTSSSPVSLTDHDIADMMNMFKEVFVPKQSPDRHPAFETLQDAIVREINSHEAFHRVPVPESGPPFTPSPAQSSFYESTKAENSSSNLDSLSRGHSVKESQLARIMTKSSLMRIRPNSESRRSPSPNVRSTGFDTVAEGQPRRRYTDAQPPSLLLASMQQDGCESDKPSKRLAYMDLIFPSTQLASSNNTDSTSPQDGNNPAREHLPTEPSSPNASNSLPPSSKSGCVYWMQAHSSSSPAVSISSSVPLAVPDAEDVH